MGSYKSAGPDGFKPIVMKHFGPIALGCINNLFQAIYSFCKSKVVFIPKPLKYDYGEAGSIKAYHCLVYPSTLLLNFYLSPWSVSLNGHSVNNLTHNWSNL